MSNPNRTIDKTFLSLDHAEERILIHRDYIAHCFRWSHVARHLQKSGRHSTAVVLDIGCGKELPLAKLLYVNKMSPPLYVGVDANPLALPDMLANKKIPIRLWAETDFCDLDLQDVCLLPETVSDPETAEQPLATIESQMVRPNVLACFEVLEHVTPGHARRMLLHGRELMADDGTFFVSTPCWNGDAAQNHINEMTYQAFGKMLCDCGFKIMGNWGTFASIRDYESRLVADGHGPIFAQMREYYDTNVLSTFFAPLYPQFSRNVLWELKKKSADDSSISLFDPSWDDVPKPWSQHADFLQMAGEVAAA